MVTIDLADVSVRAVNQKIREYGDRGEDIELLNPDARHHLGVGLTADVNVHIRGSAGYFCAGLTDGPRFIVDNNVGWGLADNMYQGSVVVQARCEDRRVGFDVAQKARKFNWTGVRTDGARATLG